MYVCEGGCMRVRVRTVGVSASASVDMRTACRRHAQPTPYHLLDGHAALCRYWRHAVLSGTVPIS